MVNNKNNFLDEGEIKFLPDVIKMKYEQWFYDFKNNVNEMNLFLNEFDAFNDRTFKRNIHGGNDVYDCQGKITTYGERYDKVMEKQKEYVYKRDCYQRDKFLWEYRYMECNFGPTKSIADYMGAIPFSPSVMFNISPNWKGKKGMTVQKQILKHIIEKYLNSCNRYDRWEAVIECGGNGDFVHAHIVAHINPATIKSVKTHINKGNHRNELIKHFEKCPYKLKGTEGILKGKFAIQRIMLNNESLVNDKLDYLHEDKKPEGHKNMSIEGFPVLFTSK